MQQVNMLVQVGSDIMPERVQDNPHAFPPGQFGGRHKVAVSGDQDDSVGLLFQRNGCDVQPNPHINGFLLKARRKIVIRQVVNRAASSQQIPLCFLSDYPLTMPANFAQPQGKVRAAAQQSE